MYVFPFIVFHILLGGVMGMVNFLWFHSFGPPCINH